jgi:hypothetical protein
VDRWQPGDCAGQALRERLSLQIAPETMYAAMTIGWTFSDRMSRLWISMAITTANYE